LRLGFVLNFGDAASRASARATLDTASAGTLFGTAAQVLRHPDMLPLQGEIYRLLRGRPDADPWMLKIQVKNPLDRGRFFEAESLLRDPQVASDFRKYAIYRLYRAGMRLPPDQLEREFELSAADTTPDGALNHLLAGVLAADLENWAAYKAVLDRTRSEATRRRTVRDSIAAVVFDGASRALEGYGLWRRGQPAEALPLLEAVQRERRGSAGDGAAGEGALNSMVRWWLGQLLMEMGRPRDALVYFRTFEHDPFAQFESAKIYAELGNLEKARESYEYALQAWRDADPELSPRIEAARQALAEMQKPLQREAP
jgi:tetratricopeptide (TPR) repeat protein